MCCLLAAASASASVESNNSGTGASGKPDASVEFDPDELLQLLEQQQAISQSDPKEVIRRLLPYLKYVKQLPPYTQFRFYRTLQHAYGHREIYDKSLEFAELAFAVPSATFEDSDEYCLALMNRASFYLSTAATDGAEQVMTRLLDVYSRYGRPSAGVLHHMLRYRISDKQGRWLESLGAIEHANSILEEAQGKFDSPMVEKSLTGFVKVQMAHVFADYNPERSIDYYKKMIRLYQRDNNHSSELLVRLSLARLYLDIDQAAGATDQLPSLDFYLKDRDPTQQEQGEIYTLKSRIELALGDTAEAERLLARADVHLTPDSLPIIRRYHVLQKTRLLMAREKWAQSRDYLQQNVALFESGKPYGRPRRSYLQYLAHSQAQSGDHYAALVTQQQMLDLYQAKFDPSFDTLIKDLQSE